MNEFNRDAALRFLYDRVNYEQFRSMPYGVRHLKLARMRRLLDLLGQPDRATPIVHIAGTKGKGSTAAILGSVLKSAGYRVGLFQSPHLERVEERFSIDGVPCTASDFIELVDRVRPAVQAMERQGGKAPPPTFFEITTAMAWLYFQIREVDIAILEVGLGGRLDSTNVCRPLVAAIISIGLDHVEQLGDSLGLIAREKAGIAKPGVPLVSGVRPPEPRQAIADVCRSVGASLIQMGEAFDFKPRDPAFDRQTGRPMAALDFIWRGKSTRADVLSDLRLGLIGRHQTHNAAVALAVIEQLREQHWRIDEPAIREGLARAACPARVEVVRTEPLVIVDGAHNALSVDALVQTLDQFFSQPPAARRLVLAATHEKHVTEMIGRLAPHFGHFTVTQYTTSPRALPATELATRFKQISDRPFEVDPDPIAALHRVLAAADAGDLICITGSLYLAGQLRSHARNDIPP